MTYPKHPLALASLLLAAPLLAAQQPQPGTPPPSPSSHTTTHHRATSSTTHRASDERQEQLDQMQDLDEVGLPPGDFWQNPVIVQRLGLTPDQVRRLADIDLQDRLKLIQLDATLQTEETKLEPMLDGTNVDTAAALAQTDRIADARAAIEKTDAHLAFGLRAILSPDQLTKLRDARMHALMGDGSNMDHPHSGAPVQRRNPSQPPLPQ